MVEGERSSCVREHVLIIDGLYPWKFPLVLKALKLIANASEGVDECHLLAIIRYKLMMILD